MSITAATSAPARELVAIVGEAHVTENPAELPAFAIDGVTPRIAVSPGTAEEIAAVLTLCSARDLVVVPAGGFTAQFTGGIAQRIDVLLRTSRLNSIEHYDPGDLTIGVGAGMTIGQLDEHLAAHRQLLPIAPPRPEAATVGGVLARGAHGPLKHGYGGERDFCIGIRFVTGDGKIAKAGARVVKSVAGFDLMKLLIGSYGTLGVIVGASFKLFPRPRQTRTFISQFESLESAVARRDRVLNSALLPMCLELVSPAAAQLMNLQGENTWRVLLRASGNDAVLSRYRAELGSEVSGELEADSEAQLWGEMAAFSETASASAAGVMLVALSVPIASVTAAIKSCNEAASANGFSYAAIGRMGIGSILAAFSPASAISAEAYGGLISAVRRMLQPGASAVVLRCPTEVKRHLNVWGASPTDIDCMRAVKQAMDDKDILNRGRFLF